MAVPLLKRHGLVVVHGIGTGRRRGAQLAEVLNGIADLLQESGGNVTRRFDGNSTPARGWLTVTLPTGAATEVIDATEVFWDDAFPSPPPRTVFRWLLALGPRQIREVTRGLLRDPANDHPADEPEPRPRDDYLAGWLVKWTYRLELMVIIAVLTAIYAFTWLLVPLLWVLYALAETPGLRMFGLWDKIAGGLHAIDPFLGASLGDTQRFLEDGMWSANIVRLAEDATIAYLQAPDIDDITIIGYSQGAAVAFDALRAAGPIGEAMAKLSRPKRLTLATVGSGINRNFRFSASRPATSFAGRLARQPLDHRITGVSATGAVSPAVTPEEITRLRSRFYWLDLYARLDAVPAGGLREEVRESARVDPSQVKLRQVINEDSPFRDHVTYFANEELVSPRLVRAVCGGEYPWTRPPGTDEPTPEITPERVRRRIDSVAALQFLRLLFIAGLGLHVAALIVYDAWRQRVTDWIGPVLRHTPLIGEVYSSQTGLSEVLPAIVAALIGAALFLGLLRALRGWWFPGL